MDFSKFKTSDWLKVGGGGLMFIGGFFAWGKLDLGFDAFGADDPSWGAFGFFFRGIIPWLLVVAVGVLTFLAAAGIFKLPSNLPTPLIFLAATALSTLLVLIMVIFGPSKEGVDLDRGIGLFLGLIAAGAALAGSVIGFKESGGDLNDLTDVNKLKSQFNNGGAATGTVGSVPPPPPGSMGTPPPPPPPTVSAPPPPPPPASSTPPPPPPVG